MRRYSGIVAQADWLEIILQFQVMGMGEDKPKTLKQPANKRLCSYLSRYIRGERGVSFVEFAIIAAPLFLLIFGIIETGLIFWGSYELENATADAARMIRTGQVASGGMNAAALKAQICNEVVLLSNCTAKVQLDVESFSNFGGVTAPTPVDGNGQLKTQFNWKPGGPGDVILVTAFYEWPLINPLTSASLGNLQDGNRLLSAAAIFRNEPFPTN